MTQPIEFLFDVASPNAYLAWAALEAEGSAYEPVPVLLGGLFKITNNRTPMLAYAPVQGKLAYEMKEIDRYVARYGLTAYCFSSHFPPNTVTAMRAATAARRDGALDRLLPGLMRAMWEEDRNVSDAEVVRAVAGEAGLDADALMAASGTPEVKDALKAQTQTAADRGAFGVPTFFVGDEMWFGKERVPAVLDAAGG